MSTGMIIDGVFASEAIDSSGEVLDVAGCDISELPKTGVLNYEHKQGDQKKDAQGNPIKGNNGEEIVGKILVARKIFSASDCKTEREHLYWDKVQVPYIYGIARLYDGAGHSGAKALAAQIRDHEANDEQILVRFSIEGTTLEKPKGSNVIKTSVARRVAATLKPCNRTAISGLLEDPNAPEGWKTVDAPEETKDLLAEFNKERDAQKSEELPEDLSYCRLGGATDVECNPLVAEEELGKALEAGQYNAAPGSLVGGAALQVEDQSLCQHRDLNRLKAAYRDRDRTKPLREVLKAQLPDVDPEFIDRFADLSDDYQMRKNEDAWAAAPPRRARRVFPAGVPEVSRSSQLRKMEALSIELREFVSALRKDELDAPETEEPKSVEFAGRHVIPGEAVTREGRKYHLLRQHPEGYAAFPDGGSPKMAMLLQKQHLNKHYVVHREPKLVGPEDATVDSLAHAPYHFLRRPDQHQLVHGMKLSWAHGSSPIKQNHDQQGISRESGRWGKSATGTDVYIKPDEPGNDAAYREGIYHNLGHEFFGMGDYLANTAVINHPDTGVAHSVSEAVPGAHHGELERPSSSHKLRSDGEDAHTIMKLGDSGELDKMALMNRVMGNIDRHAHNYVFSKKASKGMKLIDHGQTLEYNPLAAPSLPRYLNQYEELRGRKSHKTQLHPAAIRWLQGLDEKTFDDMLRDHGVDEHTRTEAVQHLLSIKHRVATHPGTSVREAYDAPNHPHDVELSYPD